MAVPKRRKTSSRRDMRRSHDALPQATFSTEQLTGELHKRHHICANGYYRGKKIFNIKTKIKDED